jgi:iron complex transport system substrate-binding protein
MQKTSKLHKTVVTTEFHNVFKSLAIFKHEGYSIVKFQTLGLKPIRTSLILKEKTAAFLTACKKYTTISVPQTIVVTSTTNIPFFEMLHVEKISRFSSYRLCSSEKLETN